MWYTQKWKSTLNRWFIASIANATLNTVYRILNCTCSISLLVYMLYCSLLIMAIATITQLVKPNSIDYEASMLSVHTFMDNNSNIRILLAHY